MIAAVIAALAGFINLLAGLVNRARDHLLLSLGAARHAEQSLRKRLDDISAANHTREELRASLERDPSRILSDDGFRRADND